MLTVKILEASRTEENFNLIWRKVERTRDQLDVDEPQLAKRRKVPREVEHVECFLRLWISP